MTALRRRTRRNRRIRPRAGFTLAEVLAACGLIAAIIGMTAIVLIAAVNGFARGAGQDGARQLGLAVYDFYRDALISARQISVNLDAEGQQIAVQKGRLLYAPDGESLRELYPDAMYSGAHVRVALAEQDGALTLRVEVYADSGVLFSKESAFRPLTLERLGGSALWPEGEGKSAENPVIYFN